MAIGDKRFASHLVVEEGSDHGIMFGNPDQNEYGWRDITADITVRGVGANDPTWAQMGSGPLRAFKFAVNDECWMCYHIPHDIVPSTDIHFHAHWAPSGTSTANVKWQWEFAYAKGFDQEAFPINSETTVTAEQAGPGTAWQHMITETSGVTIPTLTEPDGLVYVCITRVTNGGTDNTDDIFLLTADVHYQSTGVATAQKAPDFYSLT